MILGAFECVILGALECVILGALECVILCAWVCDFEVCYLSGVWHPTFSHVT